jgi:hypothetical protein
VDDLDFAIMNPTVQEALESRDIFDPASLDYAPHPLAGMPSLDDGSPQPIEDAYEVSIGRGNRCRPRAPYEPIP